MEERRHQSPDSNPLAGKGKATVGARRKRAKQQDTDPKAAYYTSEQLASLLKLADDEVNADPDHWNKHRLRALVYFFAYTGARIKEVLHLEWKDINWDKGVAWLNFKIENDLKTDSSAVPFGLPDRLLDVLAKRKRSNASPRPPCRRVVAGVRLNYAWLLGCRDPAEGCSTAQLRKRFDPHLVATRHDLVQPRIKKGCKSQVAWASVPVVVVGWSSHLAMTFATDFVVH